MSGAAKARVAGSAALVVALVVVTLVTGGRRDASFIAIGVLVGATWGWAVALEWAASLSEEWRRRL